MGAGRRVILLFIIIIFYLFIGAAIFSTIESAHENRIRTNLWNNLDSFVERNPCINASELEDILMEVWYAASIGVDTTLRNDNHTTSLAHWNLPNSFFFSTTVITTIGYGHHAPATPFGRNFCIFYGLVGIPLTAVLLSEISSKWKRNLREAGVYLNSRLRHVIKSQKVRKVVIISIFAFCAYIIVIFVPAIAFSYLEGWDFSTAHYYCFISLSTIGFGDYVASQNTSGNPVLMWLYKIVTCLYLIAGLGIWAIVFQGVQTKKKNPHFNASKNFLRMLRRRTQPWLQIMDDQAEKLANLDPVDRALVSSTVAAAAVAAGVTDHAEIPQDGSQLESSDNDDDTEDDSDSNLDDDLQDEDGSLGSLRQSFLKPGDNTDSKVPNIRQRTITQNSIDFLDAADEEESTFVFESMIADRFAIISSDSDGRDDLSPDSESSSQRVQDRPNRKPSRSSSFLRHFPRSFGANKRDSDDEAMYSDGQGISQDKEPSSKPSRSSSLLRHFPRSFGANKRNSDSEAVNSDGQGIPRDKEPSKKSSRSSSLLWNFPRNLGASKKDSGDETRTNFVKLEPPLLERKDRDGNAQISNSSTAPKKKLLSASSSLNREDSGIHGASSQSTLDMESTV